MALGNASGISQIYIHVDSFCNFIPGISTVTNLTAIVAKLTFALMGAISPSLNDKMKDKSWKKYLDLKDYMFCLVLSVPIYNVVGAILFNGLLSATIKKETLENLPNSTDPVIQQQIAGVEVERQEIYFSLQGFIEVMNFLANVAQIVCHIKGSSNTPKIPRISNSIKIPVSHV